MKSPAFWYRPFGFFSALLSPLGIFYWMSILIHQRLRKSQGVDVPVICVGNVTVGGAGKTPCVITMARLLKQKGYQVHILTRGYRGRLKGPVQVDLGRHTAVDVGDEPLILAQTAPTWVAHNRYHGAKAAQSTGADIILMDDGLQNNDLRKDFNILVVDQSLGFGNGALLPSGPLREPMNDGLNKAHVVFMIDQKSQHASTKLLTRLRDKQSIYRVLTQPLPADLKPLMHQRVFAFSGIAHPHKFYETLKDKGINIRGTRDFPDHHYFTEKELQALLNESMAVSAVLVTTEKDWVRLAPQWHQRIHCVRLENIIERAEDLFSQLTPLLKRAAS